MARFAKTALLGVVIVGGIMALANQEHLQEQMQAPNQWDPGHRVAQTGRNLTVAPAHFSQSPHQRARQSGSQPVVVQPVAVQPPVVQPVIRIASFKLNGFGTTTEDSDRLPMLTEICRRYDAIALQGISGRDDSWLQLLTDSLRSTGQKADYYFVTDQSQLTSESTQSAIVFNRRLLELDDLHWYTVNDPDNLLRRKPLVGWFRTRMKDASKAFTFSLVNVEFAAERPDLELAYLGDLFRAIRNDGRGEDDIILAGDFNAGDRGLASVQRRDGLIWVVSNTPTDVRKTGQYDNLVFNPTATVEFTGRGGVFDFMRVFNLRLHEAELLSKRLPVWAEFSVFEGGVSGRERGVHQATRSADRPKVLDRH